MAHSVRIGVEWVERFHHDGPLCNQPDLQYTGHAVDSFYFAMSSFGHHLIFSWGNDDAWSSDFDHPDFGGDSLKWSDNVHFCVFGGHGRHFGFGQQGEQRVLALAFSSQHAPPDLAPCFTMSAQWRLGAGRLKWFVIDSCQLVRTTDAAHVVHVWGGPMQGLHLLFGFIEIQWVGPFTHNRRVNFAHEICKGKPLANAWLDTAYGWENPNNPQSRPIAIAAGVSREDAINRRENETLGWLFSDVASTNWLAWKWRD